MITVMIPGRKLRAGQVVDWFGEPHTIHHFEDNSDNPLVLAELEPFARFAVDGQWRMRIPTGPVPVLVEDGAR